MADKTISESGMTFGPFPASCVFRIEKSSLYSSRFLSCGVKTCEFILRKNGKLLFIEAKTSCPNHDDAMSNEEKRKKYDEYIHDIAQKMRDSLNMYASMLLQSNESSELPKDMNTPNLCDIGIRFVLVVKNAKSDWLIHYPDILGKELRNEMKIWNIPSFLVITEEKAREKYLIT